LRNKKAALKIQVKSQNLWKVEAFPSGPTWWKLKLSCMENDATCSHASFPYTLSKSWRLEAFLSGPTWWKLKLWCTENDATCSHACYTPTPIRYQKRWEEDKTIKGMDELGLILARFSNGYAMKISIRTYKKFWTLKCYIAISFIYNGYSR